MKKNQVSRQSWIALIFLWLIFAMNANGRELHNRLMPGIIDTYGISPDAAGMIGTVSALGMCLGALPLAAWVDRGSKGWKRKYRMVFLSIGYLIFMLLNGLTPFTGAFTMVLVWQFFRGVCSGAGETAEVGSVGEWWPKEKNGIAFGLHHAAYPWGTALGGVLVTVLISVFGIENWRYAYVIFPVLGCIIFFLFWKWCNATNYQAFKDNTVAAQMTPPLTTLEPDKVVADKNNASIWQTLKNPNITVTSIVCYLCQFSYISFLFWMTPYLTFCAGYSAVEASGLSVVYAITGGMGQIFWGSFADKHGAKFTLTICCVWLIVAFYLMQYISIGLGALIGFQLLLGCCSNAVYPLFYKLIADSSEEGKAVTGNGVLITFLSLGAATATAIMGILIQMGGGWDNISGYMTGLYFMVASMVAALVLLVLFTRESSGPRFGKDFSLVSLERCNLTHK